MLPLTQCHFPSVFFASLPWQLCRIADLLELYLKELTEDALRDNFITVFQLLDEMIDNGAPLHTEANVLQARPFVGWGGV